jgi:hypothetical protein
MMLSSQSIGHPHPNFCLDGFQINRFRVLLPDIALLPYSRKPFLSTDCGLGGHNTGFFAAAASRGFPGVQFSGSAE